MDQDLVPMTKNGETLEVHPTCVSDHKRNGWVIAPKPEHTDQPAPVKKTGKKE